MHPRTTATLEKLENADWFRCVGVKDTEKAIVVASWQEAIEHCSSVEWENLLLEASNQYCERLLERSRERYNQWNDVVAQLKLVTVPFVARKIEAVVREHNLPKRLTKNRHGRLGNLGKKPSRISFLSASKVFEDTVQWDILGVCMEAEYADVFPPAFYASQAYWYVKGHFPCGWQGDFPDGTLIVY